MSADGTKELERKLDNLRDDISLEEIMGKAVQQIRSAAVLECPVHDGELRQSIYTDVYREGDSVIGECWTNKKYAPFVEFGTGPKGQENHAGTNPDVNPAYTQSPWWIHESQVDKETAERYHWFCIDTPEGKFYQCTGQAAQPFMHPALENNKDTILKNIGMDFQTNLKGLIK